MSTTCPTHEQRQSIQLYVLNTVSTFGILHTPRHTASPYPLVIILHGLASNKVGSHRSHVELAEKLSLCGIAALRVDLPGHGDAEGSLTDFSFYDYLTSVKDIIAYSHSLNNIDINKISIFGSSLGGTLALLSAPYISSIHSLAVWAPTIQGRLWLQEAMNASNNNLFTHSSSSEDILYAGLPISKIFCTQFIEIDITKLDSFKDAEKDSFNLFVLNLNHYFLRLQCPHGRSDGRNAAVGRSGDGFRDGLRRACRQTRNFGL